LLLDQTFASLIGLAILVENMMKGKDIDSGEPQAVSKSQRRRDALALKSLAAELIALPAAQLARMPLESGLRAAVEQARNIRSNVAGKRQLQYVAKILRQIDSEPITLALGAIANEARQITARQHRTEAWRDQLLNTGDAALAVLIQERPEANAQLIRQLLRNARHEAERDKPPAAARALFRLLREMDEQAALPPVDGS
jgi:ribosome-associated protein